MKKIITAILLFCSVTSFSAEHILMSGPPTISSCPMMLMAEDSALKEAGFTSEFIPWFSPDQYRAMLASKKNIYVVVSTLEYVRLKNIIKDVQLIFSEEGSPIWFMGAKQDISIQELADSIISLPFRGDMPEILLKLLTKDISKKPTIVSAGGGVTSAQLVMTGRADYVTIPEPIAYSIVKIAEEKGLKKIKYSLSVEKAWRDMYKDSPPLLVSNIVGIKTNAESQKAFMDIYIQYYAKCMQDAEKASDIFIKYFPSMYKDAVKKLIENNKVKIHKADDIHDELDSFIELMQTQMNYDY